MKSLNLEQMEKVQGGNKAESAINWACVGVGVAAIAAGVFSAGAGTAAVVTVAGAYCTGWAIGELLF